MPSCSRCRRDAVTFVRYNGRRYCARHFSVFVGERVKREIRRQCTLKKGNFVAVGLSGGKDSAAALYLVDKYLGGRRGFRIAAITVDEGIGGYRDRTIASAKRLCRRLGIEHHIIGFEEELGHSLDSLAKLPWNRGEFSPCTHCGVFRRMLLNRKARDIGATHLATGLNLDDTAQSVLMNLCRGDIDRLARMGPHREVQTGLIPRIQPLRLIPEKESYLYAMINGLEFDHSECPYADQAQRNRFRELVMALEDESPGTRHAILASAERITSLYYSSRKSTALSVCSACGEPTGQVVCRACALLHEISAVPTGGATHAAKRQQIRK